MILTAAPSLQDFNSTRRCSGWEAEVRGYVAVEERRNALSAWGSGQLAASDAFAARGRPCCWKDRNRSMPSPKDPPRSASEVRRGMRRVIGRDARFCGQSASWTRNRRESRVGVSVALDLRYSVTGFGAKSTDITITRRYLPRVVGTRPPKNINPTHRFNTLAPQANSSQCALRP
jgi:hypothetical protein